MSERDDDKQNELKKLKNTAAQLVVLSMSLKSFASEIIGHVLNGGVLDENTIQEIKTKCIRDFKNTDVTGLSVEEEAEFLRKSIEHLDKMIDMAIVDGWKLKNM